MKKMMWLAAVGATAVTAVATAPSASAQVETVRVGWCAKTVSSAAAPFAIALKMGWFEKEGIKVELVPLPGSGECVKFVATKEIPFSLPSVEPVAVLRAQGAKLKFFYTAYQGNVYGMAVPADSAYKTVADMKGKKVGVISMASASAIIARALAKEAGLDPEKDITIVVAGEAGQTAALLKNGSVDVLSQFDTQYALVENAGFKLRRLSHPSIDKFPSNAFLALEETIAAKRKQAVALAKGYAMGTHFAVTNPEAAIRIMWEIWPQTRATGKDEATALRHDIATLMARAPAWSLEKVGAKKWGEHLVANYQAYLEWLLANGIIKVKANAADFLTDELLADVNTFDANAVAAAAKAWTVKK
ncbi:MAG TPA: ABC transporter substrate-binding protein [Hyphomicrobiaceae bacterium]|nr:ABC transporter substrate-binding protein [Hyphomicrobiaceae bacterium]